MPIAATIALVSAGLAIYVAALSLRFSSAPGWSDQRWFALAAVTVAAFATLDVSATVAFPDPVVVWCSRTQVAMAGLHVHAWMRYSEIHLGLRRRRLRTALAAIPLALGALALVPGVIFDGALGRHTFVPLGLHYRDTIPTGFGHAGLAVLLACLAAVLARYLAAWRRGVPHASVHLLALGFLFLMGANDVLVSTGVVSLPYLINLGFVVPVAAVAYSVTARFTADARALAALRRHLEHEVEERTLALTRTQEELHRSEKLAGLGRLSAGVAHEVSNPAAAAASSLRYVLAAQRREGRWPADTEESLQDALSSIERMARIARQLQDAGRLAGGPASARSLPLVGVAREGLRIAAPRAEGRVRLELDVDPALHGLGQEDVLVQVLVNLVVNAIQAIPRDRADGRVVVRGERAGERVRLVVEDNGTGMSPDVLRRAFDPFFSTKAFGTGTGLGLAVSRGMVHGLGGEVTLESTEGRGTRAIVELPAPSKAPAARAVAREGEVELAAGEEPA